MLKYVLCIGSIALLLVDVIIYFDLKKLIKLHGNELLENNRKDLMVRAIAMAIISLLVGIIGVALQFI